ncbi:uracil-DNA glycosylase (plasmid) [Paracoccus sp. TK19116]|uniref:Uracil-DNA glycosylase n=1 Tax=Paracoccus albicereus TaxID=2922394 RepID=A0ABT1ML32_9RHOB|nr:uracil-DNA glycosylase [Paracoccus albicereus]MCQ0969013.1 uracil-DNA glycosylase [Paracoccus albicereus]
MDDAVRYLGANVDADTALALLQWQAEMGADEAILDEPLDRFDIAERTPAPVAAEQLPNPAAPPTSERPAATASPDHAALLSEAHALAGRATTLAELAALQEGFDGIDLKKGARRFCFADGRPDARVMVLGEAPDDDDDVQGRPFAGPPGAMLDRMFAAIGLSRDAVDAERALYLANILPWRAPTGRDPAPEAIELSLPFLRRHVELAQPEVIVLFGNLACAAALGRQGILRMRGQWAEAFGRPALPMVHPAYLLKTPIAKREAWADLLSLSARLDEMAAGRS